MGLAARTPAVDLGDALHLLGIDPTEAAEELVEILALARQALADVRCAPGWRPTTSSGYG